LQDVYKIMIQAVSNLPQVQVVLSIGNNVNLDDLGPISSNNIAVRTAPQIELLKRTTLCITHGGLDVAADVIEQGMQKR
jgi:zeaxanthin glucosyltransferase